MLDIANCPMQRRCTQRWKNMERVVGNTDMRFCLVCQTVVHRVESEAEFDRLRRQGKCVALFVSRHALLPCLIIDRPQQPASSENGSE